MAVAPTRVQPTPMQMAAERPSKVDWEAEKQNMIDAVLDIERQNKAERIGWIIGSAIRGMFLIVWWPVYIVFRTLSFVFANAASLMYASIGMFFLWIIYIAVKTMYGAGLLW